MVFIGDKKYACESCIKGHRSSACKHTDRPLFEIKRKGRPVTQCDHCRELRKTKQVHVKCMCGVKDDPEGLSSAMKRGGFKVPVSVAFPAGLPGAMEAGGTLQAISDGSDSDFSGHGSSRSCDCKETGSCHCATYRSPEGKRREKGQERSASPRQKQRPSMESRISQPGGLVASANGRGVRPVLPKPPPQQPSPPPSLGHDPSGSSRAHPSRSEIHSPAYFSPYGRAYEYTHGADFGVASQLPATPAPSPVDDTFSFSTAPWLPSLSVETPGGSTLFPSLCDCGADCACPGCLVHRGPNADPSAGAQCMNPASCPTCVECSMFPDPDALPTDPMDAAAIEEWLHATLPATQNQDRPSYNQPMSPPLSQPTVPPPFDPSMLQTYALWEALRAHTQGGSSTPAAPAFSECCGGQCGCPPGFCSCEESADDDARATLGFAVSGERASCCGDASRAGTSATATASTSAPQPGAPRSTLDGRWALQTEGSFLSVPRANLSRASSFSSGSSGHYSSSPISYEDATGGVFHEPLLEGSTAAAGLNACSTSMRTMQMDASFADPDAR
ncbi:hypothetical protein CERSUDRAFT_115065 [Gelatoporia subvermispora B]|uniref:Copper-fist domain-containing protein n=1 Tax=Ceriporiopsis subvermispora (strain B) TaxID=914234 RepID=M2QYB6_CERS8|nr:hypothetical protein CERSUDRAFT_115065 [Gelatoporia subvermispora B]